MIYLMRLGTYDKTGGITYKIGKSYLPWKRADQLEVANPNLQVAAEWSVDDKYESILHKRLAQFRVKHEIFELTDQWVAFVAGYMDAIAPRDGKPVMATIHECPDCGSWHI